MAELQFADQHNMLAMLQKVKESEGFHEIIDFLRHSHIFYALTVKPKCYVEQITQFWANATLIDTEGVQSIHSSVHNKPVVVTESSIRTHLHLDDAEGTFSIPNATLLETLQSMGYEGSLNKLTFYKGLFSPQWKFFIHTLQQCISQKRTSWNEFSSTLASAMVCLSSNQRFNFSKMIFNGMLSNLDARNSKFLMYPRFIQTILNAELTDLPPSDGVFLPLSHTKKVFSNMKRVGKGFSNTVTPLFSTMMVVPTPHGEGSGSQPTHMTIPSDSQPTPSTSKHIPQSPTSKAQPPIKKTYIRKQKARKDPPLQVPSPLQPSSPLMENPPSENIQRETTGVSPNPTEVLTKEMHEHMDSRAHTTASAQGVEQDSVNISKTLSMATLGEKSSKGPRRQETMGEGGVSARQGAPSKPSSDSPRVVNTPKGDEDRYTYDELMDTCANICEDLENKGKEIESLKKVVVFQQSQIDQLKRVVKNLVKEKNRRKFVFKRRAQASTDAAKKGESSHKQSVEGESSGKKKEEGEPMEDVRVEGETLEKFSFEEDILEEAVLEIAREISAAAETEPAAETPAVETSAAPSTPTALSTAAETVVLSEVEKEAAEILVQVKKAPTPVKLKGVSIQDPKPKESHPEVVVSTGKGKEKMVEEEKPKLLSRKAQLQLDEELARKLHEEELAQVEAERVAAEMKKLRATKKRKPSVTFTAQQERKKMITFLRSAVGCNLKTLYRMSYKSLEQLYRKEMKTLQGDTQRREEVERMLKAKHDTKIDRPFPEDSEEEQEEEEEEEEELSETLAEKVEELKRKRGTVKVKRVVKAKLAREEEEEVPAAAKTTEKEAPSGILINVEQPEKQYDDYLINQEKEKVIDVQPLGMKAPEIIDWDIFMDERKSYYRISRKDESQQVFPSFNKFIRCCSRDDLDEMHKVGLKKYSNKINEGPVDLIRLAMEYLCTMYDPERTKQEPMENKTAVTKWILYEQNGVYSVTNSDGMHEYFLVEKKYDHGLRRLKSMLDVKLVAYAGSEVAKILVKSIMRQVDEELDRIDKR